MTTETSEISGKHKVPDGTLLLTVPHAAHLLQVGVSTLHRMIAQKQLPVVRFGNRATRIKREDLERLIAEHQDG
jgi:excisionase family DNA binding protein